MSETTSIESHVSPFEYARILDAKARETALTSVVNAGRGNPNFLLTDVRDAFALLLYFSSFSTTQCQNELMAMDPETSKPPQPNSKDSGLVSDVMAIDAKPEDFPVGLRIRPKIQGIAERLKNWLQGHAKCKGGAFLADALDYIQTNVDTNVDKVVFEIVDAAVGDFYPDPPRLIPVTKPIVRKFIKDVLIRPTSEDGVVPFGKVSFFATEGATAAMVYLFHSLKVNKVLKAGDLVAIVNPIFSPYLELPTLEENGLVPVFLSLTEESHWSHLPEGEIAKLRDPRIKALFIVNPSNPGGSSLDLETVQNISVTIKQYNPHLVVIADSVYANFTDEFNTILNYCPDNVIGVYSFSKYFGVTGWRLGLIFTSENCVVDEIIRRLPERDKVELAQRYEIIAKKKTTIKMVNRTKHISFSKRLLADSRSIALTHTAGLSSPQQVMLTLLCLYELLDTRHAYNTSLKSLLKVRWNAFYSGLEMEPYHDPKLSYYYCFVSVTSLAEQKSGDPEFPKWLAANFTIEDFVEQLATKYMIIVLPGKGFNGGPWTVRVSVANISKDECTKVGKGILAVIRDFHNAYTSPHETSKPEQPEQTDMIFN